MQSKENTRREKSKKKRKYHQPELIKIGKAVKLVQGLPSGKHSDGYTGYYWE